MTIDIQKRRPYLGNLSGGMSGPAVKPMNMFLVWQAYETVHIPDHRLRRHFMAGRGGIPDGRSFRRIPAPVISTIP